MVLIASDGTLRGCLPAIPIVGQWGLNDVAPVVRSAREYYGIDIVVLRLLVASPDGGRVTYLAETGSVCPVLQPWPGTLDVQKMRHSYASSGGPAVDLAWAEGCLAAAGYARSGAAVQIRTGNLSSLWRIPVTREANTESLWLKVVPPFFAHEGAVLTCLTGPHVPAVLGHEGGRMLLGEVAGEDLYDSATPAQFKRMISLLIELQVPWLGWVDELLALGLPDWRLATFPAAMAHVLEQTHTDLAPEDMRTLQDFLARFPELASAIEACGLPPTLVHGDFHPGNVRGAGLALTLLDWGDSGVSHPLLDQTALFRHVPETEAETIRAHWHEEWRRAIPGSDPARASLLLQPVAALHQAIGRQRFIDNVEPAEHFYHLPKRTQWLRKAAELYRTTA